MVKLYPNASHCPTGSTSRMTFGHFASLRVTVVGLSSANANRFFATLRMTREEIDAKFFYMKFSRNSL